MRGPGSVAGDLRRTLAPRRSTAWPRKWFRDPAASVHSGRIGQAGYRYDRIDPSGGILSDPGPGPASHRPNLLRGSHSRELGPWPSRASAVDLRPADYPEQTPGRFQTRVITRGRDSIVARRPIRTVRIKQYHKEGRALRTETTINDTRDFKVGKRLHNLLALRKIGFQANRRLLDVQKISHDCTLDQAAFEQVVRPLEVKGQRVAALRFDDRRVQALFGVLVLFVLQVNGFANRDLREPLAQLLGIDPGKITPGQMTYDLRRLRLHGLIERIPKSHRYQLTPFGLRTALFFSRSYTRLLRPGFACLTSKTPSEGGPPLRHAFNRLEQEIAKYCEREKLAA